MSVSSRKKASKNKVRRQGISGEIPRGIAGVYDVAYDWIPIDDKTRLGGYYVAIRTSGNQFKNAPVVGLFLAAIIRACENGRDHDTDPVEVTLSRTGHVVDLSHYSRKRNQPGQQLLRDGLGMLVP
jgi:hypothetical protein